MIRSFEKIYASILGIIFVIGTGLFAVIAYVISYYTIAIPSWRVPVVLLGIIVGVLVSAHWYVVLQLPYTITRGFDLIQNKVALQRYSSVDEFQQEIADFIFRNMKFPGMTIDGGVFHFEDCKPLNMELPVDVVEKINKRIESFGNVVTEFKINSQRFIYTPVHLEDHSLGFMVLKYSGFKLPLFKEILVDFEDYYLDDQLMVVVNQLKEKDKQ
ncbi:MAG: hypothetical protein MI922_14195 [Bacteroidales bacterium]|nr:hypothetical protein [Bacteroidales bacterium]